MTKFLKLIKISFKMLDFEIQDVYKNCNHWKKLYKYYIKNFK